MQVAKEIRLSTVAMGLNKFRFIFVACNTYQVHVPANHNQLCPLLYYQPRVTVTSCFVYKVFRDLESKDHLFINPIRRIGLIHK